MHLYYIIIYNICTHLHVHTCICHKYVFVSECVLHIPAVSVLMCLCTWRSSFWASVGFGWLWSAHKKIQKVSRDPGIPGLDFGSEVSNANKHLYIYGNLRLIGHSPTNEWFFDNIKSLTRYDKMLFFRFQATKRTMSCLKSSKMKRLPTSGNQLVWPFDPKPSMQIPAAVAWQWQRTATGWRIVCEQHHGMAKCWNMLWHGCWQ